MPTTQRQLVLDAIETYAATMTVANGYNYTMATVRRGLKGWAKTSLGERPAFEFGPVGAENWEHRPGSVIRVAMPVWILVHVSNAVGDGQAERSASISNAIDDVCKLVYENQHLGGVSVDWWITNVMSDEAEANPVDSRGVSVTAEISTTVVYLREAGATT